MILVGEDLPRSYALDDIKSQDLVGKLVRSKMALSLISEEYELKKSTICSIVSASGGWKSGGIILNIMIPNMGIKQITVYDYLDFKTIFEILN
jgi:hypothetical protein